jgi:hypothetical protein
MHVNRGVLGWGVFFIALGAVPLAVRGGILDAATARRAWELWPLVLIGIGLGLALRHTPWVSLGNVVVGITCGLIAGGFAGGGVGTSAPFGICGASGSTTAENGQPVTGTLGSGAFVSLEVNCGQLSVSSAPGSGWSIAWPAQGVSAPDVASPDGQTLNARFGQTRGFSLGDPAARWDVVLPDDPALDVSMELGAGSVRANLGGTHVSSLAATVNAGDAHIDLSGATGTSAVTGDVNAGSMSVALPPAAGTLAAVITANAGSVRICAPAGVPVRITMGSQTLSSVNFAQRGMTQEGDTWTRGAWGSAASRIDLRVSVNLGSITLDPEDGCG